jgi:hypothetical protein
MTRPTPRITQYMVNILPDPRQQPSFMMRIRTARGLRTVTVYADSAEEAMCRAMDTITGTVWYWDAATKQLTDSGQTEQDYDGPPRWPDDSIYDEE